MIVTFHEGVTFFLAAVNGCVPASRDCVHEVVEVASDHVVVCVHALVVSFHVGVECVHASEVCHLVLDCLPLEP